DALDVRLHSDLPAFFRAFVNGAVAEFSSADARDVEKGVNAIMPRQATFNGRVDLAGSLQVGDVIAAADLLGQRAATPLVAADDEGRRAFARGQPHGRRADAGRACDQANFIRKSSPHTQSLPITPTHSQSLPITHADPPHY